MKNSYLLAAAMLAAPCAHAQQAWQPFRPGLTYQLSESATAGDTTHTLRLGAGSPVAGTATDSLFRFAGRVGRISGSRTSATCNAWQRLRPDNLFGATLRSQPRAVFVLAAANGRTCTLRPRAPLGQSWATGLAGLTASVTGRAVAAVLGAATDSVATITLSDGEVLRLSKSYGLLAGPSLDSYLNGRNQRRHLSLTALPERRLGTAVVGALATYDYQPGDVFQRITRAYAGGQSLCQQTWWQDSVLTRQLSRTGDTLTYTIRTRRRSQSFGQAGAPNGFCSVPSANVIYPAATNTVRVIASQPVSNGPQLLTGSFSVVSTTSLAGYVTTAAARSAARFGGRPEHSLTLRVNCGRAADLDSLALGEMIDNYATIRYAAGLGQTYSYYSGIYDSSETQLVAYRKGTETWGTFFTPSVLLAAREVRPAATTAAFPNPFGETLTVSFVLTSAQPVGAILYDALGRQVRAVPPALLGLGSRQLVLATAGLPAGVYTLHLRFGGEGRREVLKVVKAE